MIENPHVTLLEMVEVFKIGKSVLERINKGEHANSSRELSFPLKKGSKLTLEEVLTIETLIKRGWTNKQIEEATGRSAGSITTIRKREHRLQKACRD